MIIHEVEDLFLYLSDIYVPPKYLFASFYHFSFKMSVFSSAFLGKLYTLWNLIFDSSMCLQKSHQLWLISLMQRLWWIFLGPSSEQVADQDYNSGEIPSPEVFHDFMLYYFLNPVSYNSPAHCPAVLLDLLLLKHIMQAPTLGIYTWSSSA